MIRNSVTFILSILLATALSAQLQKDRSFRVDPLSAIFKEYRVAIEYRLKGSHFIYFGPYFHHQNVTSRYQKYSGAGLRAGYRRYFNEKKSPAAFFLQPMASYRFNRIQFLNAVLDVAERTTIHSPGIGLTAGKQWFYGHKDNIIFGFMAGLEYYFHLYPKGYRVADFQQNWYELPISNKPSFLNGLKIYAGIEIGFAFKQKRLHW